MFGEENDRPHKYPSCADLTRRVIDYQMAGKRDCRQPTLIRALKQFKVHTWICNMYSSLMILLILMHIKLFIFSYARNHCMNPPSETWKLIQKKLQTSDIKLLISFSVVWQKCNLSFLSEELPQEPNKWNSFYVDELRFIAKRNDRALIDWETSVNWWALDAVYYQIATLPRVSVAH